MTRSSIREYTEAIRERYLRASKKEKSKILDEFTKVTGYHRKAAIYSLNPVSLLKQINENLESLWNLAEHPAHQQRKVKTYKALVT